ncbi:membrane protein insertion efficiency factor YidD [Mycobacterium shigaense]|uniref:membrane protein insertion efficiency factor YidD n=1 Tax=Mycobacterium shigaense TaxID=722731 RepID=UPI000BBADCEE|nr:membrane protein insertion efficiency factor YidD [Mycobacterium shigaense]MEA1121497.1 membrane protein insertion efficiency factor YidD [Mycobacterium shigaense]PRI15214.1 membrane protein insertion efficiency factor YidD [Mycobacterium shigaense]
MSVRAAVGGAGRTVARGLVFVIQLYRHMVSPLRPATCRFIPTCSQYAVDALTEYGLIRGSWLAIARLVRCGPWHRGGWDPIPERPGTHRDCRTDFEDTSVAGSYRAPRGESESLV